MTKYYHNVIGSSDSLDDLHLLYVCPRRPSLHCIDQRKTSRSSDSILLSSRCKEASASGLFNKINKFTQAQLALKEK